MDECKPLSVGSVIEKAIPESERKLAQHAAQVSTPPNTSAAPQTCHQLV